LTAFGGVDVSAGVSAQGLNGASGGAATVSSVTTDVFVNGKVDLSSASGSVPGNGGYLNIFTPQGSVYINSEIDLSGSGRDSTGGIVTILANGDIVSGGNNIVARGLTDSQGFSALGGHVALASVRGMIDLAGG